MAGNSAADGSEKNMAKFPSDNLIALSSVSCVNVTPLTGASPGIEQSVASAQLGLHSMYPDSDR
jgi:hypothetical protein